MKYIIPAIIAISILSCQAKKPDTNDRSIENASTQKLDTATLAGGCFWCTEASFEQIEGVQDVVSGYSGGKEETARYKVIGTGKTGHAECVQVYFDPEVISYEVLLKIFFTAHDPTQLNRQGPDVGTQYRSAIFYHNEAQLETAKKVIAEIQPDYDKDIVTEINPLESFFKAEYYHQDFEKNHPNYPYIQQVSRPKIERVKMKFEDLLKEEEND